MQTLQTTTTGRDNVAGKSCAHIGQMPCPQKAQNCSTSRDMAEIACSLAAICRNSIEMPKQRQQKVVLSLCSQRGHSHKRDSPSNSCTYKFILHAEENHRRNRRVPRQTVVTQHLPDGQRNYHLSRPQTRWSGF